MSEPVRVYLVRHAKAERDHPDGDAARRLTHGGRARFYALAGRLAPRLELAQVVTSPFVRARQTAEILAAATGAEVVEARELASGKSSGREILAFARAQGKGVALVGHNPEMAEAIALAAGEAVKVRPGTLAALDVGPRGAQAAWIEAPHEE